MKKHISISLLIDKNIYLITFKLEMQLCGQNKY